MVDTFTTRLHRSVDAQLRRGRRVRALGFGCLAAASIAVGLVLMRNDADPVTFAWFIFFAGLAATVYQPRYGIYLMLLFTLLGDWIMFPWYPFWKNFSSVESIFFVHRYLIVSPLETYMVVTFAAWLGRGLVARQLHFFRGPLFWPIAVFMGFIGWGLAFGLALGGNANIALWEARPISYLPALFVLTSNLITMRRHVNQLIWVLALALFARGIEAVVYVATVLHWQIHGLERIGNHAMSIYFASFFVLAIAVWLFRDTLAKRVLFPLMLPPMVYAFFANQRRASFVALGVAFVLLAAVLFQLRRRLFWALIPPLALAAGLYFAAFWNHGGMLGFPIEAFKSVIGMGNARNAASNEYRLIENANIMYTLRLAPFGVGFGRKFYILYQLPDISFFEWWEYQTHNSVLWMWMKMGPFGFVVMLFMFGMAIIVGARALMRLPGGVLSAAALTATLYIVMHCIYAYVDISWDLSSMVYLGVAMGLLNRLDAIAATPVPVPAPRWPWQRAGAHR